MSKLSDKLQANLKQKSTQSTPTISAFENNLKLQIEAQKNKVLDIKLEQIYPNKNQPRQDLETNIDKLKASIEQEGLLQPIIIANLQDKPGHYIIVAGHRRYKAHQELNLKTIKAIVNPVTLTAEQLDEKALLENLQRENLSTYEIAETLTKLHTDQNFNIAKIQKLTGYRKTQVYDYIKCFKSIKEGKITKDQLLRLGHKNCLKILSGNIFPAAGIQEKNSQSEAKEARKKSKSFFKIVIKDIENKEEIEKAIKASENQLLELKRMLKRLKK